MTHEVYVARMNGEVVYVGEGRKGRHQHLTSGTSVVYLANLMHFIERDLDIEVTYMEDKESAQALEAELIDELQPLWNIFGTRAETNRNIIRNSLRDYWRRMTIPMRDQPFMVKYLFYAEKNLLADNSLHIFDKFTKSWDFQKAHLNARRSTRDASGITPTRIGEGEYRIYFDSSILNKRTISDIMDKKIK